VDTGNGRAGCDSGGVDDEVADLAVEDVDRSPIGVSACRRVWIVFDHGELTRSYLESAGGLESWKAVWVSDHLGVVVVDDRSRDDICSGREVDDSRSGGRRVAYAWCAAIAAAHCGLNSGSVIRVTITFGAKVLDIAKDLVAGWVCVERGDTLMLNVLHPVGT